MSVVRFPRPNGRVQPFVEVIGPGEKGDPYDIIVWKNDECHDGYTFQVMEYADVLRVLSVIEETYGSKMRRLDGPDGGAKHD